MRHGEKDNKVFDDIDPEFCLIFTHVFGESINQAFSTTQYGYKTVCFLMQSEACRRKDQELLKIKKDFEMLNQQHESSEATQRKRHQEATKDMTEQLEHCKKEKHKFVLFINYLCIYKYFKVDVCFMLIIHAG